MTQLRRLHIWVEDNLEGNVRYALSVDLGCHLLPQPGPRVIERRHELIQFGELDDVGWYNVHDEFAAIRAGAHRVHGELQQSRVAAGT